MENNDNYIKELLQKYAEGACNKEELDLVLSHLSKSEKLRDLLRDMQTNFAQSISSPHQIKEETSLRMKKRLLNEVEIDRKIVSIHRFAAWWKYAAVILAFLAFGYWAILSGGKKEIAVLQTITTAAGEQREITLPDHTVVFMNGSSELSYPDKFVGASRVIRLKGEAFFHVTADKEHPFYVIGKNFTTKVVGTSFNIDTDLDPSVTVATGIVQVVKLPANESATELLIKNKKLIASDKNYPMVQLVANEKASLDGKSGGWQKEQDIRSFNWREGEIAFYNKKIELIVKTLERSYGVDIKISDEMKKCDATFTLPLIDKDLDRALRLLGKLSGSTVKKIGNRWELKGGECDF